ncbi:MAG: response regulator [Bacteroidota bacterium]
MNNEIEKIQSDLLVLSLSIGQSIDLEKNSSNFITFLSSWKDFGNISVWIVDSVLPEKNSDNSTSLIASTNIDEISLKSIGSNHRVFEKLKVSPWFSIGSRDADYREFRFGIDDKIGFSTFFKLGEIGFIRIYNRDLSTAIISKSELDPLLIVISKFTTSVKACIAYRESVYEKEIAKNEAELAIESKSRFLNTMTHEIRDPMNAILGLTEMLRSTGLTKVQESIIDKLNLSSNNLVYILNEILDFSKLEAGQLEVDHSTFKVGTLVQSVMDDIERHASSKSLLLKYDIDSWVKKPIIGDWGKIHVILVNLLRNAVKYTNKGEINLQIKPLSLFADSVRLEFSIIDTGIGIDESKLDSIFNSYFIEETRANFGSKKIGLALAKRLVELMGGVIKVESKLGVGSVFSFYLDFDFDLSVSLEDKVITKIIDKSKSSKIRILLVENSPINQEITLDYLSDWNTVLADSGKKAIEILKKDSSFGVILMNLRMDDLDGVAASRIIRDELKLDTPIIAITTEPSLSITNTCRDAGMDASLLKPFTKNKLIESIVDNLSQDDIYIVDNDESILDLFKGKRVLVVDDDMITQLTTKALLGNCNFEVILSDNGVDAISKVNDFSFDLILTDLFMPEMDGFELSKKLRDLKVEIPIIAFSSDDSKQTNKLCNEAGINSLMLKKLYTKMEWAHKIHAVVKDYPGYKL